MPYNVSEPQKSHVLGTHVMVTAKGYDAQAPKFIKVGNDTYRAADGQGGHIARNLNYMYVKVSDGK